MGLKKNFWQVLGSRKKPSALHASCRKFFSTRQPCKQTLPLGDCKPLSKGLDTLKKIGPPGGISQKLSALFTESHRGPSPGPRGGGGLVSKTEAWEGQRPNGRHTQHLLQYADARCVAHSSIMDPELCFDPRRHFRASILPIHLSSPKVSPGVLLLGTLLETSRGGLSYFAGGSYFLDFNLTYRGPKKKLYNSGSQQHWNFPLSASCHV